VKNPCVTTSKPIDLFISNVFSFFPVILILLPIALLTACAGKKMSVEEARQVAVSMSEKSFVPPPRRIDDILTILDQPGQFDSEVAGEMKAKVSAPPPKSNDNLTLADFYFERGNAAIDLGRPKQALKDLRTALMYAEKVEKYKKMGFLLFLLGKTEKFYGNFKRGLEYFERSNKYGVDTSYGALVLSHTAIGNLETANKYKQRGISHIKKQISYNQNKGNYKKVARKKAVIAQINFFYLDGQGKYAEAEQYIRSAHKEWSKLKGHGSAWSITVRKWLSNNLEKQGRLIEAELEARQALKEAIGFSGKESTLSGDIVNVLGEILLAQGRLEEAEKLALTGVGILENSVISSGSQVMGDARMVLGNVLTVKANFTDAMKQFGLSIKDTRENQYLYNKFVRNSNLMLCLLQTGRAEEAMKTISAVYNVDSKFLGVRNYKTAETLALRGMAYAKMKRFDKSLKDFSEAVPLMLEQGVIDGDYMKKWRLKIIAEAYIELLEKIKGSQLEKDTGIDVAAESFKLASALAGHTVQSAIGASSARAAVIDPNLTDLIRREQDALKQIQILEVSLSDILAAPVDQQLSSVIENLLTRIKTLSNAHDVLIDEIKTRFPKYYDFTNPQPATVVKTQQHLRSGEALISIYTSDNRTYVWFIPRKGKTKFSTIPLGNKEVGRIVANLRKALNPDPETYSDIPEFDLNIAYDLYSKLLKPVENGWKDAKNLLIITSGPLDQLPFSILPTAPVKLGSEKNELFANYREVPWLILKASITRYPSVSSFITLRKLPPGDPARKIFVGFGDPYFNQEQLVQAEKEQINHKSILASHGGNLHVRGIRVTQTGALDNEKITSSHLGLLNRLPDTAEEIKSIAKALDADLTQDIFLGKNASEDRVKTMDLSDRRIIAFATHALVPGDLDGLDQPAIALSSSSVTGGNEDGLLTMGEVLKLKLNADWVVLSACNTGAAGGAGAEAVSGLGRAFFYAGTRAILVSMWPVETTSAKKLTTRLFQYQREDKTLSRARALQKSILALIDDPGLKDEASGKIVASYAHPLFWAPFIIVGEGGGSQN